jgi:hypothetical protein
LKQRVSPVPVPVNLKFQPLAGQEHPLVLPARHQRQRQLLTVSLLCRQCS